MAITFKEVRKLQSERVRMQFDDGREVVAQLLCATKDIDGSKHLIYNKVESVYERLCEFAELRNPLLQPRITHSWAGDGSHA